jgi:3-oxoadipate enol-lactonase
MPTLSLSAELSLHYFDVNARGGPTVLLLHGLGATADSWKPQVPALVEAGYRVLIPDQRGFGRSTYPGSTGIVEMAHDAAQLLRGLTDGPVHVVGISMGGTVALQLALEHPALIESLVLVNTAARLRPYRLDGWLSYAVRYVLLWAIGQRIQARLVARNTFPLPHQEEVRRLLAEQIVQANRSAYLASLRALGCFNVLSRLEEICAPTLIVTGERDGTISPARQRLLADGIAGARHEVIPDAGHGVTADQPALFNELLLEFFDSARAVEQNATHRRG